MGGFKVGDLAREVKGDFQKSVFQKAAWDPFVWSFIHILLPPKLKFQLASWLGSTFTSTIQPPPSPPQAFDPHISFMDSGFANYSILHFPPFSQAAISCPPSETPNLSPATWLLWRLPSERIISFRAWIEATICRVRYKQSKTSLPSPSGEIAFDLLLWPRECKATRAITLLGIWMMFIS